MNNRESVYNDLCSMGDAMLVDHLANNPSVDL